MNKKTKITGSYYDERSSGRSMNFNRLAFLTFTLYVALLTAAICFLELKVQMSPLIQNVVDILGRIIFFPAVSLVINKIDFLWVSEFYKLWFYLGLVFNCAFYGFLFERVCTWIGLDL